MPPQQVGGIGTPGAPLFRVLLQLAGVVGLAIGDEAVRQRLIGLFSEAKRELIRRMS